METLGRSDRHAENAACEGIDMIVWYAHGHDYSLVDQIRKQTAGGVAGGGAERQPGEPGRVLRSGHRDERESDQIRETPISYRKNLCEGLGPEKSAFQFYAAVNPVGGDTPGIARIHLS